MFGMKDISYGLLEKDLLMSSCVTGVPKNCGKLRRAKWI
jgi:hypothetical protein